MSKRKQHVVGEEEAKLGLVTTEHPLVKQLMESRAAEEKEAAERRERHETTAKLMQEFFADPENARLLEVREEDEVSWRDLPGPPAVHPEPTEEEIAEVRARFRAEFLRRREERGA